MSNVKIDAMGVSDEVRLRRSRRWIYGALAILVVALAGFVPIFTVILVSMVSGYAFSTLLFSLLCSLIGVICGAFTFGRSIIDYVNLVTDLKCTSK